MFKPVDQWLSLIAAIVSLGGIAVGAMRLLPVNTVVFFGIYCSLLALLIFKATFVPTWSLRPRQRGREMRWLGSFAACSRK